MTIESLLHQASQRLQSGDAAGAESLCRQALSLKSDSFDALATLAQSLCGLNRIPDAIPLLRRAAALRPDSLPTLVTLAGLLHQVGRIDQALPIHRQALALDMNSADRWNDLGVAHFSLGQTDDAITHYRHAISLRPDHAEAYNNLACAVKRSARYDEAMVALGQAISLHPDYPAAHWNMGLIFLVRGELDLGWPEYEWRWQVKELSPPRVSFPQPRWEGQDINDRRILLYSEQGFGDAIQFVRYIPLVANRGAKVILTCQRELLPLFANIPGVEKILPIDQPLSGFDFHCPLMSLPLIFKTTLTDIPARVPYLHPDPTHAQYWRQRLADERGLKIGLAWAGRASHFNDRYRSLSPAALAPLADIPGATFFSLQKGEAARQAASIAMKDWSAELTDFAQTAALIQNLDLVITADTAVAHLAGALGRPVWVLLPFIPDWRWLLDRPDSPWYPTMRLFRQTRPGDWPSAVEPLAGALRDKITTRPSGPL